MRMPTGMRPDMIAFNSARLLKWYIKGQKINLSPLFQVRSVKVNYCICVGNEQFPVLDVSTCFML